MSDLLAHPQHAREPGQASGSEAANPLGLDGLEFVEYATTKPQALGQVLEIMGFVPMARHRSREVTLYRQGGVNIVVNANPDDARGASHGDAQPSISAMALRVRNARLAREYVLGRGGWEVPSHPDAMELNIPAIHGVGGSRLYFIDRYQDFSIYDVDFLPIPVPPGHAPLLPDLHFFGVVQYIGMDRSPDWVEFYKTLLGCSVVPTGQRFGIMPAGTLLRAAGLGAGRGFMLQLVEPVFDAPDPRERLQRIGLGVPDVLAAVQALRARGVEFVEGESTHTEQRGAVTKTYLGSVVFELVQSPATAVAA
jgi:4-hydroxyphenylpyruvate dioxygenase